MILSGGKEAQNPNAVGCLVSNELNYKPTFYLPAEKAKAEL